MCQGKKSRMIWTKYRWGVVEKSRRSVWYCFKIKRYPHRATTTSLRRLTANRVAVEHVRSWLRIWLPPADPLPPLLLSSANQRRLCSFAVYTRLTSTVAKNCFLSPPTKNKKNKTFLQPLVFGIFISLAFSPRYFGYFYLTPFTQFETIQLYIDAVSRRL